MSDSARRTWPVALLPKAPAGGWAEPLVGVLLVAGIGLVLAFDLRSPDANAMGNPTAIVIVGAAVAGWALRLRWAVPVWLLSAGVGVAGALAGVVLPLNALAIAAGSIVAGVASHVGGTTLRDSLAALDRQIHLIRRASALVSGSSDPPAMLDELLLATVEILGRQGAGDDLGAAALELGDAGTRVVAAAGASPVPGPRLEDPADAGGTGLLGRAVRSARRTVTDASGRVALARIDAAGQPWGVLVAGRRHGRFTRREVLLLEAVAELAGVAIDTRRHAAELERERRSAAETARQLRLAVEAAKDVGFEVELDEVTRRLLARAVQAVGAERGSIGRIDGDRLIVEADWSASAEPGPAGRMMSLAGVPGLLDTLRAGHAFQQSTGAEGTGAARHVLQCPLLAGGELVGVMALSRGAAGPFDRGELEALQQLTSLTALTLRSARHLAVARNLGQAKSEFLNMAAHELRTPLAVVRGYLSMMADGTLDVSDTTRQSVVGVLCQKTDELSAMIEQILGAVQIQAGRVPVERHVFDLREAIAEALDRARPRAAQAGVELWSAPLPEPVWVDAAWTSVLRILDNLIGNAITYGNQLPVRLTVDAGADVLVRVEDQGLGIAADQQERLFEPFFRVDQPSVQGPAGAGLGLAVSRQLAELSGGSLELEWSQPGAGSTFALRLPAPVEPALQAWQRAPVS
ncbi:MAG: GAF domain-containing sensor histidine kinase [Chloroflexi bacterium]|nr:MAG: GAF domain-containing sensor histidine kinase [Chloroflexota bacterium]